VESSIYVWNDTKTAWGDQTQLIFRDKLFDTTYWISYSLAPSTDNCSGFFIETFVSFQPKGLSSKVWDHKSLLLFRINFQM